MLHTRRDHFSVITLIWHIITPHLLLLPLLLLMPLLVLLLCCSCSGTSCSSCGVAAATRAFLAPAAAHSFSAPPVALTSTPAPPPTASLFCSITYCTLIAHRCAMGRPHCHFRSNIFLEGVYLWYLIRPGESVRKNGVHVP